jgi:hypothetical protein
MAMDTWTVRKSYRNASARSQELKEIAAEKYSAKVSKKPALVAAYRLGYSNVSEDYSDTFRERLRLSPQEEEQYQAGWYARNRGMDSEF